MSRTEHRETQGTVVFHARIKPGLFRAIRRRAKFVDRSTVKQVEKYFRTIYCTCRLCGDYFDVSPRSFRQGSSKDYRVDIRLFEGELLWLHRIASDLELDLPQALNYILATYLKWRRRAELRAQT